jgi:hypothetical protein
MMSVLPLSIPSRSGILQRLPDLFPEGMESRGYLIREIAASTIFVMLYGGAVEGSGIWIRPDQVTKMTGAQAAKTDQASREKWVRESLAPGGMKNIRGRWYSANTRESIRDETLRMGLVLVGAVVERQGIPTTSAKPRYAVSLDFAKLFDTTLSERQFEKSARAWQADHLSPGALARIRLRSRGAQAATTTARVLVTLPSRETRWMAPGPSSVLSKAVIEIFAPRYLKNPALLFLSESGNKVVSQDQELARSLGLKIDPGRNLPDVVLADIGPKHPLLVFAEVVVTDGAITRSRRDALISIAQDAGFPKDRVAFVTAFEDRSSPVFRRLSSELAWGTVAWFASEPEHLLLFMERTLSLESLPY